MDVQSIQTQQNIKHEIIRRASKRCYALRNCRFVGFFSILLGVLRTRHWSRVWAYQTQRSANLLNDVERFG
jgi:hypothetical protein